MAEINFFNRKVFRKDLIFALLIITLPFLFYLYLFIPPIKVFKYGSFIAEFDYYESADFFAWHIFSKGLFFLLLSIWYITCKHVWKYALLVPMIIELYKFFAILNDEFNFFTHISKINTFLKVLPFTLPIIILIVFISKRAGYFDLQKSSNNNVSQEISKLIRNESNYRVEKRKQIEVNFSRLKNNKNKMNHKDYLRSLIKLRNNLLLDGLQK